MSSYLHVYENFANSLERICSAYSRDPQIGTRRLKQRKGCVYFSVIYYRHVKAPF